MLLKQLKYFISIVEKENFTEAPIEAILKVDLYGTAVLLEEVGKVIKKGILFFGISFILFFIFNLMRGMM